MTADYCTVADIKEVLPNVSYGTGYDAVFGSLITRASRMIDRVTRREPGAYATGTAGTSRYYTGSGKVDLWVDEMAAAPSVVAVDEVGDHTYTTWGSGDYMVWPYNTTPYTKLEVDTINGSKAVWYKFPKSVRITAPFGFSVSVPDDIKQAVVITAVRAFQRGKQGYEDVGAIAELGQLRYVKQLDPEVQAIIEGGGYIKTVI